MKTYAIAALAAVPCVVAVAPAATVDDYAAVVDEYFACVKEMSTVLASVKDKASADAAAVKLTALNEKSKAIEAKANALGEPSEETDAQLKAIIETRQAEIAENMQFVIGTLFKLSQMDFYGSDSLKNTIEGMIGAEDEE